MEAFEREVLDRLTKIETKLDGYSNIKTKVYDNERRIILIEAGLTKAETKLEEYGMIESKVYDSERQILLLETEITDTRTELKNQQEESRWLKRTVAAAIITGIIGIGIAFLRLGMGV